MGRKIKMNIIRVIDPAAEVENITSFIKNYFIKNGPNSKAIIGISGGKDSTVAAALLCRALGSERVIGVLMPQDIQTDIEDSRRVCEILNIDYYEINIGSICDKIYNQINQEFDKDFDISDYSVVSNNTPSRVRMTVLYAIAGAMNGRVVNTCNYSENMIGWNTKFGDTAGDFSLFYDYTVTEVKQIGRYLSLPTDLIDKAPADGLCGKTDEDKFGFTYEVLDKYLRNDNSTPDYDTLLKIETMKKAGQHKHSNIPYPQSNLIYIDSATGEVVGNDFTF